MRNGRFQAEIILDKVTNKPRGFGFVTFNDYDPVDQCVLVRSHMINGYRCDVKKGLSKEEMNKVSVFSSNVPNTMLQAQQTQRDRSDRMGRSREMGGPPGRGGFGGAGSWGPGGGGAQRGGGSWNQGSYGNILFVHCV